MTPLFDSHIELKSSLYRYGGCASDLLSTATPAPPHLRSKKECEPWRVAKPGDSCERNHSAVRTLRVLHQISIHLIFRLILSKSWGECRWGWGGIIAAPQVFQKVSFTRLDKGQESKAPHTQCSSDGFPICWDYHTLFITFSIVICNVVSNFSLQYDTWFWGNVCSPRASR